MNKKLHNSVWKSTLNAPFLFCWNSVIILMLIKITSHIWSLRSFNPLPFKWQKQWDDPCSPNLEEKSLLTIGQPPSWCYPLYFIEGVTSISCLTSCWKGRKSVRLNLWKGFTWGKLLCLWSGMSAWHAAFDPSWNMSLLGTGKVSFLKGPRFGHTWVLFPGDRRGYFLVKFQNSHWRDAQTFIWKVIYTSMVKRIYYP